MSLKGLIFGTREAEAVSYRIAKNTRDWLPIADIQDGIIQLKDGRTIKLVEVTPVNFYLKSPREQEHIIAGFASYLKIAPDNLQIRVITQKADLEASMNSMWERYDDEDEIACREMIEKGVYLLNTLAQNQTLRRRFFLVISHVGKRGKQDWEQAASALEKDALNAIGMLAECGLEVVSLDTEAARDVFHQILNKRTSRYLSLEEPSNNRTLDYIAPDTVDTRNKHHIIVDDVYHSILYISGYGYPTQVFAGWLGFLVEADEGVSLSFHLQRQRKDKAISKISKTTMISRSRMRDVGDMRSDSEQLECLGVMTPGT
jgi:hypothetical protein